MWVQTTGFWCWQLCKTYKRTYRLGTCWNLCQFTSLSYSLQSRQRTPGWSPSCGKLCAPKTHCKTSCVFKRLPCSEDLPCRFLHISKILCTSQISRLRWWWHYSYKEFPTFCMFFCLVAKSILSVFRWFPCAC